jgi:gliding motility-associated-like protein
MKYPLLIALCIFACVTSSFGFGPKKPRIQGQQPLSMIEDQSLTINFTDLFVEDQDDWYPFGFTMEILPGDNYTFNGRTITPVRDFNGDLFVNVTVNDGNDDSNVFPLKISVSPVNDPPFIVGQVAISTTENIPYTLKFSDLTVSDVDSPYPTGFSMQLQAGNNYSISGTTITPSTGFSGKLSVPVTVNDGALTSGSYTLQITVIPANKKPVITGQSPMTAARNKSFTVEFSNLTVSDPDSKYPDEFTLVISAGSNYTFSGKTVTPAPNFTGILNVNVAVNDGHSTSDPFTLKVEIKDELTITGQSVAETNEDEKFTLQLSHLTVYDPQNKYPTGFNLVIEPGQHYTFTGSEITPEKNYSGMVVVGVKVSNGTLASPKYNFQLTVKPVNDPPELVDFPAQPVRYTIGGGATKVYNSLTIADPDDNTLILAEVGFSEGYQAGNDMLSYTGSEAIKGVFDSVNGILSLIGQGSHDAYKLALESVTYDYTNLENPVPQNKRVYVKLNDGKTVSLMYEREIVSGEDFEFDIPTAFSPNNDQANDTWKIRPNSSSERYNNTVLRVFNQRGVEVFQTVGFKKEWDGTFNGQPAPEGSYIFSVDLNLNYETEPVSGSVTIFR